MEGQKKSKAGIIIMIVEFAVIVALGITVVVLLKRIKALTSPPPVGTPAA